MISQLVRNGLGNGFVQSGNKSLPEPMPTKLDNATWRH